MASSVSGLHPNKRLFMKCCSISHAGPKRTRCSRLKLCEAFELGASLMEAVLLVALLTITAIVAIHTLGREDRAQIKVASQAIGGGTESSMSTTGTTTGCPKSNPHCDDKLNGPPPEDGDSPD